MNKKIIKKGNYYYPTKEVKEKAFLSDKKIYQSASKEPLKFWEEVGKELFWFKKWEKIFSHKPPYFKWFEGGKINITFNIFEKNPLGWERVKNKVAFFWEPEPFSERERTFTYYQLFCQVNKLANALKKIGVKKGDKVGIYLPMIPEVIISMLALARIGAVHTVVFSAFSPQALRIRLKETKAKVLITADGYFRRGKLICLKKSADEGIKETEVEKVIVVKRAKIDIPWNKRRDLWYHQLIKKESDFCKAKIMEAQDPQFILFTSGSTGKPKGCLHVCGGYSVYAKWSSKVIFDLKESDIFFSTADIGWITGHTYSCYGPLLNGATFLIYEGAIDWPRPDRWAEIIEKYGVTIFYTAPTAIRMFEEYEKYQKDYLKKYKFKTLRILASVGEPIDESAWKWYFEKVGKKRCPILDTWWQTETGGILITSLVGIGPFRPAFTGLPLPAIRVAILNEDKKRCKRGEVGNLVILPPFAPSLLRIIYKNPKKYLQTYWSKYGKEIYFTADSAFYDKKGLIRIVGRVDDVIKVAGHRLTSGELESAINFHPDITECAVVGIPDKIKGQALVAFIILKKEREKKELEKEISSLLREKIGPIAKLKRIFIVRQLPKTRSGKIMRRILRRLFTKEPLGDLSTLANPESVEEIKKSILVDK